MKLKLLFIAIISIFALSYGEVKNKYFFNPYLGYFMFDKQRHIDSGVGGGVNFGYFLTEKFGLDVLFGFVPTKHFSNDRTVFALSFGFIKIYRKAEDKFRPFITFGFGGNKNIGFFWGLTGGVGFKYLYRKNLGIDTALRGFYLWNGRLDGIFTLGLTYLFR